MQSAYEIKDRTSSPPGGFIYRHRNGKKSMGMPALRTAIEMCRQEHSWDSTEAMEHVLGETYLNIPQSAREYFITKVTEGLVYQNRTFRYVDKKLLLPAPYHYNPGLITIGDEDWLVYRRQMANADSTICRYSFKTQENHEVTIPAIYLDEQFEDPRVLLFEGDIIVVFSSWRKNWTYKPIMRVVRLDEKWRFKKEIPFTFGGNGQGVTQKNWQLFVHDGKIHMVYWYAPWEVVEGDGKKIHLGRNLAWGFGELRGGTPPVRVGWHYYTFFHSRTDSGRARYYMGCLKFEAEPPFKPVAMTDKPLLTATNREPSNHWSPLTVFPCGCIYKNGNFCVSLGVNDLSCGLCDWTMDELSALLRPL